MERHQKAGLGIAAAILCGFVFILALATGLNDAGMPTGHAVNSGIEVVADTSTFIATTFMGVALCVLATGVIVFIFGRHKQKE